jgi:predicted Zn-dependent protease
MNCSQIARRLTWIVCSLLISACSAKHIPVPAGVIPEQTSLVSEDEQYGHEVLNNLTEQYPLDRDDGRINRVRDVVDRLTKAAKADKNPWNSYVLVGDDVKNAAATRGNYIFVWTGILKSVNNDAELATILAHEIGHVLAGHTAPDPSEETNKIISGIAGQAAGGIVGNQGLAGPVSDLAELIVRASLEALLVNPGSQLKEYEADQIGLFIMSDAGYDPQEAINFWSRIQNDPDFRNSTLEFLSSHPNTSERLKRLTEQLGAAEERYQATRGIKSSGKKTYASLKSSPPAPYTGGAKKDGSGNYWKVMEPAVSVFSEADKNSALKQTLKKGDLVKVLALRDRWLEINDPVQGYVQSKYLAPED